ncbi:MAG: ABC transporter substrate-binding protein [Candidatus Promineifilaceae bacterium]
MSTRRKLLIWLFLSIITAIGATAIYRQVQPTTGEDGASAVSDDPTVAEEQDTSALRSNVEQIQEQLQDWVVEVRALVLSEEPIGTTTEGSLVIYSTAFEESLINYITAFRTKYPEITITYELMEIAELTARVTAERDDPYADVLWGVPATTVQWLAWQDTLAAYAPSHVQKLPLSFRDNLTPPEWVGFAAWMNAICVNKQMLQAAGLPIPKTWADLTDPQYQDMILMPNPKASQTGYLALQAFIDLYGEVDAWAFMDLLDKNIRAYPDSATGSCRAVGDGDVPIAISYAFVATEQAKEIESAIAVFPSEGTGWEIEAAGLIRKFPVKPAAMTLMDFIISEEAMHEYGQSFAVTAIELDYLRVPVGYPEEPSAILVKKDFTWASANSTRLLDEWQQRYERSAQEP